MMSNKAMIRVDPRVRLATSNSPDKLIYSINDEDNFENVTCSQTGREDRIEQKDEGMFIIILRPLNKKFLVILFSLNIFQVPLQYV